MAVDSIEHISDVRLFIEHDHRELDQIIRVLEAAGQSGSASCHLEEVLGRLVQHAGSTFRREERLMRTMAYPGIEEHMRQHEMILEQLAKIIYQFETGNLLATKNTLSLLRFWAGHHVSGEDVRLDAYLSARIAAMNEPSIVDDHSPDQPKNVES